MIDNATLSRVLFEAREYVDMMVDTAETITGKPDNYGRDLLVRIDALRSGEGWDPNGYGGEL